MHYAPIYYKGTCKPDPVSAPSREISSDGHVREWTLPFYLHKALRERDRLPLLCECGQPAAFIGAFEILTANGTAISGGDSYCAECAMQVDSGVRLTPL